MTTNDNKGDWLGEAIIKSAVNGDIQQDELGSTIESQHLLVNVAYLKSLIKAQLEQQRRELWGEVEWEYHNRTKRGFRKLIEAKLNQKEEE